MNIVGLAMCYEDPIGAILQLIMMGISWDQQMVQAAQQSDLMEVSLDKTEMD